MTTQCKICNQRFATDREAQDHLWGQHRGFIRKPVVTGVEQAIKMGIKPREPEPETIPAPGSYWGFSRRR